MEARRGHTACSVCSSVLLPLVLSTTLLPPSLCSCVRSLCFLSVPAPVTPPRHSYALPLSPLLSVPLLYCALAVLCSSPLRPRWTVLTLCSKINFETNKAATVFACSVIFCQKCSEGYVLICCQDAPPPWLAAFSIYALVSKKRPSLHGAKEGFLFKCSQRGGSRAIKWLPHYKTSRVEPHQSAFKEDTDPSPVHSCDSEWDNGINEGGLESHSVSRTV